MTSHEDMLKRARRLLADAKPISFDYRLWSSLSTLTCVRDEPVIVERTLGGWELDSMGRHAGDAVAYGVLEQVAVDSGGAEGTAALQVNGRELFRSTLPFPAHPRLTGSVQRYELHTPVIFERDDRWLWTVEVPGLEDDKECRVVILVGMWLLYREGSCLFCARARSAHGDQPLCGQGAFTERDRDAAHCPACGEKGYAAGGKAHVCKQGGQA